MIPILDIVSNGLGAIKEFFGFQRERSALKNTPEMTANAEAKDTQKTIDEDRAAVARGDEDEIRRKLS